MIARTLLAHQMRVGFFVFVADELDQLRIEQDALLHLDGPRLGVSLRIFHGDVHFEMPETNASEPLRHFSRVGQWAALDIQPYVVAEAGGLYHQRIAIPMANRVTIPPRIRIVVWQRTTVHEDLPHPALGFVQDHNQSREHDNLPGLWMHVQLRQAQRQTVRVGIVLVVVVLALLPQRGCPRRKWKSALDGGADVEEFADAGRTRTKTDTSR